MFILNTNDVGAALFAKGQKVESGIDLWHKRIGHVNYQRLQDLQSKHVVFGLPKFSGQKAQIWDVGEIAKQHRFPFSNERNRSWNKLDMIHADVGGPTQNVSLGGCFIRIGIWDALLARLTTNPPLRRSHSLPPSLSLPSLISPSLFCVCLCVWVCLNHRRHRRNRCRVHRRHHRNRIFRSHRCCRW